MTDKKARDNARRALVSGSPEDLAKVLRDRLRSGLTTLKAVQVAAGLGDPVARLVVGEGKWAHSLSTVNKALGFKKLRLLSDWVVDQAELLRASSVANYPQIGMRIDQIIRNNQHSKSVAYGSPKRSPIVAMKQLLSLWHQVIQLPGYGYLRSLESQKAFRDQIVALLLWTDV